MSDRPKRLNRSVANTTVATHNQAKRRLEKPSVSSARTRAGVKTTESMTAYTLTALSLSDSRIDDRPAAAPRGGGR